MASEPSEITNGNGLPPAREAIIDQAHRLHQEVAHHRDMLLREVSECRTEIAGLKAQLQIAELAASQLQSRSDAAGSVRDDAVRREAEVRAVLGAMLAIGRAFEIENQPLIREVADAKAPAAAPTGIAAGDIL